MIATNISQKASEIAIAVTRTALTLAACIALARIGRA
jgi:hypothetical protein